MNGLLNMRVSRNHLRIQIGMLRDHDLRIKGCSHKNCVNAAAEGGREDVGDLQTNEECKGHHDWRIFTVTVVCR